MVMLKTKTMQGLTAEEHTEFIRLGKLTLSEITGEEYTNYQVLIFKVLDAMRGTEEQNEY